MKTLKESLVDGGILISEDDARKITEIVLIYEIKRMRQGQPNLISWLMKQIGMG